MDEPTLSHLRAVRRDLHRHPEPAWCEFYTTSRIVDELERLEIPYHLGASSLSGPDRMALPDAGTMADFRDRAVTAGAREDVVETVDGGYTGIVAELDRGPGPTVAVRVDIDGLRVTESTDGDHVPAAMDFRSEYEGMMHACGHDAHATIGIGVLEAVLDSDFAGTLKVFFQPAEEVVGGGKAMANSEHVEDVDYLIAIHVGLEHPTGEIVAGVGEFLAVSQFDVTYHGAPAHAGGHPEAGRNAVLAMATAVQNLYSIPRHHAGETRVNAGLVHGGTAPNVIPESATIEGEVRGETTDLMDYMRERADRVLHAAADMHDCGVDVETVGEAPSAESDADLAAFVSRAAEGVSGVDSVVAYDALGGSEDASFLMQAVQDRGGLATYVGIGTDHPGGHHTATFDVDEDSIAIGVDVVTSAICDIAAGDPLARGATDV